MSRKASGNWANPNIPKDGWRCVSITDLDEPDAICEMCTVREIRYQHHMVHADWSDEIAAGRICAGKMENNRAAATRREQHMKNLAKQRANWHRRKNWQRSAKDNSYIRVGSLRIVVFRKRGGWGIMVEDIDSGAVVWGQKTFKSRTDAKKGSFAAKEYMTKVDPFEL